MSWPGLEPSRPGGLGDEDVTHGSDSAGVDEADHLDDVDEPAEALPPRVSPGPAPLVDPEGEEEAELYFSNLDEFVTEFFAPLIRRDLSQSTLTWCPRWWAHPEASYRLDALWRAWEHLRLDAAMGPITWLEHLDRQLPTLLSYVGPFRGCSPEDGHKDRDLTLPLDPAPPGWA